MTSQTNHPATTAAAIGDATSAADVEESWQWGEGLAALSVVTEFREALNRLLERELAAAFKRLPGLTPAQRETVERLSEALMNEFMHEPSLRLHAAAASDCRLGIVDIARYLFGLDEGRAAAGSGSGEDARAA